MHQQNVSVLGLSVTEERSVQNFYRYLCFGHLPPAADRHQHEGAEPAQHNQQHADTVNFQRKQQDERAATKFLANMQRHKSAQLVLYVADTLRYSSCRRKFASDWLIFFSSSTHRHTLHNLPLAPYEWIFISVQRFMKCTTMQADYLLITIYWINFLESFDVSSTCCNNKKKKSSFFFFLLLLQEYDINFPSLPSELFGHSFVKRPHFGLYIYNID